MLQVGITSGNEDEQEEFVEKCQGNVWRCLLRDQASRACVARMLPCHAAAIVAARVTLCRQIWSAEWDTAVRAELHRSRTT